MTGQFIDTQYAFFFFLSQQYLEFNDLIIFVQFCKEPSIDQETFTFGPALLKSQSNEGMLCSFFSPPQLIIMLFEKTMSKKKKIAYVSL